MHDQCGASHARGARASCAASTAPTPAPRRLCVGTSCGGCRAAAIRLGITLTTRAKFPSVLTALPASAVVHGEVQPVNKPVITH